MCTINVQTNMWSICFLQDGACYPPSLCPQHTHKGIPWRQERRMNRTIVECFIWWKIKKNEQTVLLPYLSGFAIHPCFPPLWQVTVPLSLFAWSCLKPLASSQHCVCVCVCGRLCMCVRVFFPSLQMMEVQRSPCVSAPLSLLSLCSSSIISSTHRYLFT